MAEFSSGPVLSPMIIYACVLSGLLGLAQTQTFLRGFQSEYCRFVWERYMLTT